MSKDTVLQNIYLNFAQTGGEQEELLLALRQGRLARIMSAGDVSPPGCWYEQAEDEWVMVLAGEGELEWACGAKKLLKAGDWVFLPARERHRVSYTSAAPPCVWLALYGDITMEVGKCQKK